MKKNKASKTVPDVELDFSHSRAGLNTHKVNTAEQHRLEEKLRSLETQRRRSVQLQVNEQRGILQSLAANQHARIHGSSSSSSSKSGETGCPSKWGENDPWPNEFSASPKGSGLSGPLQHDLVSVTPLVKDAGSECRNQSRRSRRPSVVLHEAVTQPVIDVSSAKSWASPSGVDNDTIIDMIAARNKPRNNRRASIGGPASILTGDVNHNLLDVTTTKQGLAKEESSNKELTHVKELSGSMDRLDVSPTSPIPDKPTKDLQPGMEKGPRRTRRGSIAGPPSSGEHEHLALRLKESPLRLDGGDRRAARRRRASVDVGMSNLSLLSPTLPVSRHVPSRRSSLASSQGTPSTPSTPDSKTRDVTSFAFPPVANPTSSSTRHSYDVRPALLRRHSSDNLLLASSSTSRHGHGYVTAGSTSSHGHHQRNSSLKLPRMQRRRKSVVPCVNNMVLLHSVLQNSSSFKASEFQEGRL